MKNQIIFDETIEDNDEEINIESNTREIDSQTGEPEVKSLMDKYKRGNLIVQPDFQRQYIWDKQKATSLIESALLRIPLPVVYLAEEINGKKSVIDGQQRLTSLFSFINGRPCTNKSNGEFEGKLSFWCLGETVDLSKNLVKINSLR